VIDHSTTTAQAAGHSGGTYGKGGDLLYRWGNPNAYQHGTAADESFMECIMHMDFAGCRMQARFSSL